MERIKVLFSQKPESLIILLAFVFGSLYIFLSPPFQVPDSPNHFFRTYQLATGQITPSHENNTVGGWVPKSFYELQESFTPYRYNAYHKMDRTVLNEVSKIELNEEDKVYMHFPNTGVYSPVSYIPQTIAMRIGLWLNLNPLTIYYLVRIFAFLFWMGLIVLAFKFFPIKKLLLGVLLLLPMSLFINSSFSADMMINGLSWLYLALILNIALTKRELTTKLKVTLLVIIMLIGLSKLVYIPIVLTLLLIPFSKFQSKLRMGAFIAFSIFLGFGSATLWKNHIDSFYTSYLDYNPEFRDNITLGYQADMNKQMEHIKANKLKTVGVFASSYVREYGDMMTGYIGNLGWNRFRMPIWFVIGAYFILLFFAFNSKSEEYFLSVKQKMILIGVVGCSTILVMLSQYLTWNPVGNEKLWPLMGRYFTPIYPMLFLVLSFPILKLPKKILNYVFLGYLAFSLSYTCYRMNDSFYVNTELELAWEYDFMNKSSNSLLNGHEFEFGLVNGNTNVIG
ncbi:MAG: DUF2142 domain-containing protein, partial [Flavobacteriales bacterium]